MSTVLFNSSNTEYEHPQTFCSEMYSNIGNRCVYSHGIERLSYRLTGII